MTDNETIKALECCIRNEYCCMCEECPLDAYPQCEEVLYIETVDLINRQKAEIKQKDTEIDILIRKKETLKDEIAELRAEVERLETECEKQYEIAEASIRANIADGGTSCHWCIDSTKAEAYKEFAERLKKKAASRHYRTIWGSDVDEVLAEMESERE